MKSIRRSYATSIELERLHHIWLEAVQKTHHFLSTNDIQEISKMVKDDYLPSQSFDVIVDQDDQPVGFMGMTQNKIDALFIHPSFFGQGAGSQLIHWAQSNFEILFVDVNEANQEAFHFYRKNNFKVIERTEKDDQGRPFPLLKMKWEKSN